VWQTYIYLPGQVDMQDMHERIQMTTSCKCIQCCSQVGRLAILPEVSHYFSQPAQASARIFSKITEEQIQDVRRGISIKYVMRKET
jgi:hypothetical protein